MDFSVLIPWICTSLNAPSTAELGQWTEAELYAYAEESLQNLGGRVLLIAKYDDSIGIVVNQPLYELPASHIATIFAAIDGTALRPSSVAEVEALDDNYEEAASGTVTRWIGNQLGSKTIRTYPAPSTGTSLQLIYQQQPPTCTPPTDSAPLNATIPMPAAIGDYMAFKALKHARMRQGDGQMTDAAGVFEQLASAIEQAAKSYYGAGN